MIGWKRLVLGLNRGLSIVQSWIMPLLARLTLQIVVVSHIAITFVLVTNGCPLFADEYACMDFLSTIPGFLMAFDAVHLKPGALTARQGQVALVEDVLMVRYPFTTLISIPDRTRSCHESATSINCEWNTIIFCIFTFRTVASISFCQG